MQVVVKPKVIVEIGFKSGEIGEKCGFSPYDTPDGALAGLVSDSGVGVGYNLAKPVCGVCTTTTTLSPEDDPIESDEAAAVADPHVSYGSKKADLCCEGKGSKQVCKLC